MSMKSRSAASSQRCFRSIRCRAFRELLDLLERAGVPVAIASSSPARWVVPAATRLGIASRVRSHRHWRRRVEAKAGRRTSISRR